ncbi:MAG: two-component regulator propeller domain-containing protein [Panacibacter sp.]
MQKLLLIVCLYFPGAVSFAQSYHYLQYSVAQGLSNNIVFDITEDKKGFMWFATDNGLCRFDGISFKLYNRENGLPGNSVATINVTDSNELLIACYSKGICKLKNDSVTLFPKYASTGYVNKIKRAGNDFYFINNRITSSIYKYDGSKLDTFPVINRINDIIADKKGRLYSGSCDGLFREYKDSTKLLLNAPRSTYTDCINSFAIAPDNRLYIGLTGKIIIYEDEKISGEISEGLPEKAIVHRMVFDKNGNLWIAVLGYGLYLYKDGRLTFLNNYFNLGNFIITFIYCDSKNNIWFGTYGRGVFCLPASQFTTFTEKDGLQNSNIYSMATNTAGELYAGTLDGIYKMEKNKVTLTLLKNATELGIRPCYSLSILPDNSLLAGMPSIYKTHVNKVSDKLKIISSHVFEYDKSKKFLYSIGQYKNLIKTDLSTYKSDTVALLPIANTSRSNDMLLIQDTLWIANPEGLFFYYNNIIVKFKNKNITAEKILSLAASPNSGLWIGTDEGVFVLHNGQVKHYTIKDGLPDNFITSIVFDKNEQLFVGTLQGLSVFNGSFFRNYYASDGLADNAINTLLYDSLTNWLWIGTTNGISRFTPGIIKNSNPYKIPIYITNVFVNNLPQNSATGFSTKEKNVQFSFVGLFYSNPHDVQYEYRLRNVSDKWITTTTGEINYSSLSPGTYIFQVRVNNTKANLVSDTVSYRFIIEPFFYQTLWFKSAVAVIIAALLFGASSLYFKHERKKRINRATLEADMATLKQQALNAMMNPHFIFNALGSIQHYLNQNNAEKASFYLNRFARLIRKNLDTATRHFITLEDEIERLKLYLEIEKMRAGEKLSFSFTIAPGIETDVILVPSMMIQPFIENAIIHGILPLQNGGTVHIEVAEKQDKIFISISDDGMGIKNSLLSKTNYEHKSMGMEFISKRLHLLSIKYNRLFAVNIIDRLEAEQCSGTKVILELPILQQQHVQ